MLVERKKMTFVSMAVIDIVILSSNVLINDIPLEEEEQIAPDPVNQSIFESDLFSREREICKNKWLQKCPYDFFICENKDADQLRGNHEADQRLCFRYTDSTIPLLSESKISSL